MKLTEIITLLKAGYTKSEISEIVQAEKEAEEAAAAEHAPGQPQQEPEEPKEPEPNYKKLYEESQTALKQAQQLNINKANSTDPAAQETAEDIILKLIGG